jgi:uncharacterized protein YdeI (YjbR/CyaY-like superfamily)
MIRIICGTFYNFIFQNDQMELYFKTREEWHEWLEKSHSVAKDVWLIYYKKPSGKPRIPYDDAVEEALCFGWIDGKIKRINEDYYIQHFTPRRHGSRWSMYNIKRVEKLIKEGKMEPAGMMAFREVLEKPELIYENRRSGEPEMPEDLSYALSGNSEANKNFRNFSQSGRRMYIEWLKNAKKPETRIRRINKIVEFSEKNIRPGMM